MEAIGAALLFTRVMKVIERFRSGMPFQDESVQAGEVSAFNVGLFTYDVEAGAWSRPTCFAKKLNRWIIS